MAYQANPLDEEQKRLQQQGLVPPAQSGGASAYASAPGGSAPSASAPAPAAVQSTENKGSGFVGLDKYRVANKANLDATAKTLADKAKKEFDSANTEMGKLDTNAGTFNPNYNLLSRVGDHRTNLTDDDKSQINAAMNFKARDSMDTSAYDAAYQSGYDRAKSYSNRDVQLAALKDIYDGSMRGKGMSYTDSMASLDASLADENKQQIEKSVDEFAKNVKSSGDAKKTQFQQSKSTADAASAEFKNMLKQTAEQGRAALKKHNEDEITSRTPLDPMKSTTFVPMYRKTLQDRGTQASMGDVVDSREENLANFYDELLGGKTFDNLDKTYVAPTYKTYEPSGPSQHNDNGFIITTEGGLIDPVTGQYIPGTDPNEERYTEQTVPDVGYLPATPPPKPKPPTPPKEDKKSTNAGKTTAPSGNSGTGNRGNLNKYRAKGKN